MKYHQLGVVHGDGSIIGIGPKDHLHVAGKSRVKVFDAGGAPQRTWEISRPASAIAIAGDGSVWVGQTAQIEIFDSAGKRKGTWRDAAQGDVTAIGFFQDSVLVADVKDRGIRHYDKEFKFRNVIGKDNLTKGFLVPNGSLDFSVDAAGILHAANPGKHRVERYSLDGELLGHVGRFDGQDPAGFPGCCNPTNLALGPHGWIYVTEKAGPRAKVLDRDGKLVAVIADGVFDPACKNMDIALDSRGRVYVADTEKLAVFVFEEAA